MESQHHRAAGRLGGVISPHQWFGTPPVLTHACAANIRSIRLTVRRDDLDQVWKVENLRRSLAMLPTGAPGLTETTP